MNEKQAVLRAASQNDASWIKYVNEHPDEPLLDMYVGTNEQSPSTLFGTIPLPYSTLSPVGQGKTN
jgi:hypothetical protein